MRGTLIGGGGRKGDGTVGGGGGRAGGDPVRSASRGGHIGGTLAVLSLLALSACEPTPAARPAALISAPVQAAQETMSAPAGESSEGVVLQSEAVDEPAMAVEPEPEGESDPEAYPEWNGYDLDCADVGRTVRVSGDDPHRLDRDGDGWGCESY